jgi:hypothetical protein
MHHLHRQWDGHGGHWLPTLRVTQPTTGWQERIAPDEAERFERYAREFVELQRRRTARFGEGRALHRRQLMALTAQLEVLPGLPDHARHGLFRAPGLHDAWVRLSNGSMNVRRDEHPDVRGYAIKVFGVEGPGALGGTTDQQNFALINLPAFSAGTSREFAGLIVALSHGSSAAFRYLVRTHGLIGGIRRARRGTAVLNRRFTGFATEPFFSAAAIACGPYAARVRLCAADHHAAADASRDWAADVHTRLRSGPLVHDLQLQFFSDEATTPIENAAVDWPEQAAPYLTVARLTIPPQDLHGAQPQRFAAQVERSAFDPWNALMEHRPLGDVMRARRVVYYASQKERGLA